ANTLRAPVAIAVLGARTGDWPRKATDVDTHPLFVAVLPLRTRHVVGTLCTTMAIARLGLRGSFAALGTVGVVGAGLGTVEHAGTVIAVLDREARAVVLRAAGDASIGLHV